MKKILYLFFLFLISCSKIEAPKTNKPLVAVSIPPYLFFVKAIAENTIEIKNLVPAGADPHHFEPSPKHLNLASKAAIWFCSKEPFEKEFLSLVHPYNKNLKIYDLSQGIDLIENDTHFWLSPKLAARQAKAIAAALKENFPENAALYQKNLKTLVQKIEDLDLKIQQKLSQTSNKAILSSHRAFSYFCKDYELVQLSVENNHKEPDLKSIYRLLQNAKKAQVKKVFIQAQVDNKGAFFIADKLNVSPIMIDPYSEDYLNNLKKIADLVAEK